MINLFGPITKQMQKAYMRTVCPIAFSKMLVRTESKGNIMALVYAVEAGPVTVSDVVSRKLSVTVNGTEVSSKEYSKDTTAFGELGFGDNDKVVLSLVDVDDAGNASQPAVLEFVASDTLPPPQPGEFGVRLVREE